MNQSTYKHDWRLDGKPGEYDFNYKCAKCGAAHTESFDNLDTWLRENMDGCIPTNSSLKQEAILFTKAEIQSGLNRIKNAEGLILQLPQNHSGRNTWLLNYGESDEAIELRSKRNLKWDSIHKAAYKP